METIEIITRAERHRRWSPQDRARILAECDMPGAVIARVAERNDIAASMIYKWRKRRREEAAQATLPAFVNYGEIENLPDMIFQAPIAETIRRGPGDSNQNDCHVSASVEIHFTTGERMVLGGQVSVELIHSVIRLLRRS